MTISFCIRGLQNPLRLSHANLRKRNCRGIRLVGVLGAEPLGEGVGKDYRLCRGGSFPRLGHYILNPKPSKFFLICFSRSWLFANISESSPVRRVIFCSKGSSSCTVSSMPT